MKKIIYILLLGGLLVALAIYESCIMARFSFLAEDNETGTEALCVVTMLLISLIAIAFSKSKITLGNGMLHSLLILISWIWVVSAIFSFFFPFSKVTYAVILLPLFLFLFMKMSVGKEIDGRWIVWGMTFVFIYLVFSFFKTTNLDTGQRVSASYYVIYSVPFILCHDSKIIRFLGLAASLVCSLFSMKVGSLLGIIVSIFVYLYVSQKLKKKANVKFIYLGLTIIIAICVYRVTNFVNESVLGGGLLDHIDEVQDSGGSGRLDIYSYFIKIIFNSGPIEFLIGRGWLGSERTNAYSHTCHNDFLESFVDFGVIGFLLYIAFLISLVKLGRKLLRIKHQYAPAMWASIAIFVACSSVSHVIYYTWFFLFFALFWGFIVASVKDKSLYINNISNK